jgi:hypothetical protein
MITERVATVEGSWIDEMAVAEGTVEERVDECCRLMGMVTFLRGWSWK